MKRKKNTISVYKKKQRNAAKFSKQTYWGDISYVPFEKRLHTKQGSRLRFNEENSSYKDYLLSEEWGFIKECHYLAKFNQSCQCCGSVDNLEVHHSKYYRLGSVSEFHDLHTLCRDCHQRVHDIVKSSGAKLYDATIAVIIKGSEGN